MLASVFERRFKKIASNNKRIKKGFRTHFLEDDVINGYDWRDIE